ncbi:CPBP family intramembrane metalloprotease [Neobacillus mesonae]|nr:CPBP family intramembrane metalloprotease [Neobacillus mesonae]
MITNILKKENNLSAVLFIFSIIILQYLSWSIALVYAAALFLIMRLFSRLSKEWLYLILAFSFGYSVWALLSELIYRLDLSEEWKIILSRSGLIGFIVPFIFLQRHEKNYLSIGSFRSTIYFPLIWKGLVKDPMWRFLLVGIIIITAIFSFIIDFAAEDLLTLTLYGLLFSAVNSILEEILWRGMILSKAVSLLGPVYGLCIASLGFGLYHYSIGFSWFICILFAVGGLVFGGMTIRAKGILPSIILHFVMNMMFCLSGIIF